MARRVRRVTGVLVLLVLGLPAAGVVPASGPPGDAQAQARAAELAKLRQRIRRLHETLEEARGRHAAQQTELRAAERRIGDVARALERLERRLAEQRGRLRELEARRERLHAELRVHREALARQVRAAYATGRQERLKLLLNQEDPGALGRILAYYDYLNRARAARIEAVVVRVAALREVERSIVEESARLARLREERRAEKRRLEEERQARHRVLAALNAEIRAKGRELEGLLEDERELERLFRALEDVLADIPAEPGDRKPFPVLKGRLPWPVQGRLLARYGASRKAGQPRWRGVLIAARRGAPVRAVSHGRVAFADWLRGVGLLVIIDHGDGYMTLYGHNQSLYKEVGDWVEAGEVIASVGDSGGQPRAGLYFEIRHRGRPVNPFRWCRGTPRQTVGWKR